MEAFHLIIFNYFIIGFSDFVIGLKGRFSDPLLMNQFQLFYCFLKGRLSFDNTLLQKGHLWRMETRILQGFRHLNIQRNIKTADPMGACLLTLAMGVLCDLASRKVFDLHITCTESRGLVKWQPYSSGSWKIV